MKFIHRDNGRIIRGPTASDTFIASYTPISRIDGEYTRTESQEYGITKYETTGDYFTEAQLQITILGKMNASQISTTSLTTDIATVNEDNYVSHVSDGTAAILVSSIWRKQLLEIPIKFTDSGVITTYPVADSNSIGLYCENLVDNAITGVTESNEETVVKLYSTFDSTTSTYIRNADNWAYNHDFSFLSVYNSTMANGYPSDLLAHGCMGGTLISPRHVLFVTHWHPRTGCTMRWVTSAGVVCVRTLVDAVDVGDDQRVGILDADVDEGINYCRLLPPIWADIIPSIPAGTFPVIACNQFKESLILNTHPGLGVSWGNVGSDGIAVTMSHMFAIGYPQRYLLRNGHRYHLYGNNDQYSGIIGGDSGSPAVTFINGIPVLLNLWSSVVKTSCTTGGVTTVINSTASGRSVTRMKDLIDASMASLSASNPYSDETTDNYQTEIIFFEGFE